MLVRSWLKNVLKDGMGDPFQYSCLRVSWTEKPGGQSIGCKEEHTTEDLAKKTCFILINKE